MADGFTADGRPFGGTEQSWWLAVPGGTGISVLALLFSRPVSLSLLESALRRLQASHPILRTQITTPVPGQPAFSLADTPSTPLRSLSASDLPPSPFHAVLEQELNQNPWSEPAPAHPVLFATAYDGVPEPGRSVLALRYHTVACDRTSSAAILEELLRLMAGGSGDEGFEEEEGLQGALEDLIPKQDTWKPFWARGKDLIGYSLNGLRTSTVPFEDTSWGRRSEVVRLVLSVEDTEKLLMACRERGIKLCGAIAAAAMVATHSSKNLENDKNEIYNVVTLIDCRKYLDPALNSHNLGFYHSAIINTHNIREGEEFWEVARRCHDSYSNALTNKKHLKDISELNFLLCKAIDNPQVTPSSSQRTSLISVFEELAVLDLSERQQKLGVDDYLGCSSIHGTGPSIAVFDTIRNGRLDCSFVYPSPLHSRKQIEELVQNMKRILISGELETESSE